MLNAMSLMMTIATALTLRGEFRASWTALGGRHADALEVFDAVAARYAEVGRVYHVLDHVVDCAQKLSALSVEDPLVFAARPLAIVAFVFHHAIYDLRPHARTDNERESLLLFRTYADGFDPDAADVIDRLILSTRTHVGQTLLEDVFIDIDVSILGADPVTFAAYERGIRRESAWVDEARYRTRRAEVAAEILARPFIFSTRYFRSRYEFRARMNLAALIEHLKQPRPGRR